MGQSQDTTMPGGGSPPTGIPYWWWLLNNGSLGGYGGQSGYYGTGGGMGYIHGSPENDALAWNLFLEMQRNGWDVNSPFGTDEARRGMGDFTSESYLEYLRNRTYPRGEEWENLNPEDPNGVRFRVSQDPADNWLNELLVSILGRGKLGTLNIDDWIRRAQEGASGQDWLDALGDDQMRWVSDWLDKLGADKNWDDRISSGDAPWSRGQDAIDNTSRQNPEEPGFPIDPKEARREPADRPPKEEEEGGGGPGWTPPPLGPLYTQSQTFNPYFLAWQPTNTSSPVQFTSGGRG